MTGVLPNQLAFPHRTGELNTVNNYGVANAPHPNLSFAFSSLPPGTPSNNPAVPFMPFFGVPEKFNPADPYWSHPRENYDLPEAFKGPNVFLSTVLINIISESDQWFIRIAFPLRKHEGSQKVVWDQMIFDDGAVGRTPEQSVSRLLTSRTQQMEDHVVRHGIAFLLEHGFMTTPRGRMHYWMNLKQIANAIIETLCYGAALKIIFPDPRAAGQAGVNNMNFRESFDALLQQEIDTFDLFHKQTMGTDIAVQKLQFMLSSRSGGKKGNLFIVSDAVQPMLARMDPRAYFLFTGQKEPNGELLRSKEAGITVVTFRQFRLSPEEALRPHRVEVVIGGHANMVTQISLAGCPPGEVRTDMMDIYMFDEPSDDMIRMSYQALLRDKMGFYRRKQGVLPGDDLKPDSFSLTQLGRSFFGSTTFYEYMRTYDILNKWVRSLIEKPEKTVHDVVEDFVRRFAPSQTPAQRDAHNAKLNKTLGTYAKAYFRDAETLEAFIAEVKNLPAAKSATTPSSSSTEEKKESSGLGLDNPAPEASPSEIQKSLVDLRQTYLHDKKTVRFVGMVILWLNADKQNYKGLRIATINSKVQRLREGKTTPSAVFAELAGKSGSSYANVMIGGLAKEIGGPESVRILVSPGQMIIPYEDGKTGQIGDLLAAAIKNPKPETFTAALLALPLGPLSLNPAQSAYSSIIESLRAIRAGGVSEVTAEAVDKIKEQMGSSLDNAKFPEGGIGVTGRFSVLERQRAESPPEEVTKSKTKKKQWARSFESLQDHADVFQQLQDGVYWLEPDIVEAIYRRNVLSVAEGGEIEVMTHDGKAAPNTARFLGGKEEFLESMHILKLVYKDLKATNGEAYASRALYALLTEFYFGAIRSLPEFLEHGFGKGWFSDNSRKARAKLALTEIAGHLHDLREIIGERHVQAMSSLYPDTLKTFITSRGDHVSDVAAMLDIEEAKELKSLTPRERQLPSKQQIESILKGIRIERGDFFFWSLENDCYPLLGIHIMRPSKTYITSLACMMVAGSETGNTLTGHHRFELGDYPARQMHFGHYTFYGKSVVWNPLNIAHLPNVMVEGYVHGNGTAVWNPLSQSDRQSYQDGKTAKDIFLCPLYPHENPTGVRTITGRPHPAQQTSDSDAFPAFAPEIAKVWGWTDGPNLLGRSPYEQDSHYNTLLFPEAMFACKYMGNNNVDPQGQKFTAKGHFGKMEFPGVAGLRRGALTQVYPPEWVSGAPTAVKLTV